jgi:hypothetical protein
MESIAPFRRSIIPNVSDQVTTQSDRRFLRRLRYHLRL